MAEHGWNSPLAFSQATYLVFFRPWSWMMCKVFAVLDSGRAKYLLVAMLAVALSKFEKGRRVEKLYWVMICVG